MGICHLQDTKDTTQVPVGKIDNKPQQGVIDVTTRAIQKSSGMHQQHQATASPTPTSTFRHQNGDSKNEVLQGHKKVTVPAASASQSAMLIRPRGVKGD